MDDILDCFMINPEKEYHIRELARLTKKSPTTISKYLKMQEKTGILKSHRKFGHLLFKANTESSSFRDLKRFYNIKKLRDSGLIDFLVRHFNNPEAIVLFGSYCKGEDIPESDIDMLIITQLKKEVSLERFEKILNRRIHLLLHSNNDIKTMKVKNKELLNNMLNGVVLYGFWELLK